MGDSPNNAGEASKPESPVHHLSPVAGCLVVLATVLTFFVVVPYAVLAFAFWSADGSWDFEGDGSFRYWYFYKGSRAAKLGLVEPTDKPVKYSVSESDGNFPGWTVIQYESKAAPAQVIDDYAKRCEDLKAKVTERKEEEPKDGKTGIRLECEFKGYLTAEFFAERAASAQISEVGLRVWGRE
jgi:hypothetical protein